MNIYERRKRDAAAEQAETEAMLKRVFDQVKANEKTADEFFVMKTSDLITTLAVLTSDLAQARMQILSGVTTDKDLEEMRTEDPEVFKYMEVIIASQTEQIRLCAAAIDERFPIPK